MNDTMNATNGLLKLSDLARYVGYSHSHTYKNWKAWAASGLSYVMPGKTPRFRVRDVEAWIQKSKQAN